MSKIQPIEGLELIDRLPDSPILADSEMRSKLITQCVLQLRTDPAALRAWLENNPSFLNEVKEVESTYHDLRLLE